MIILMRAHASRLALCLILPIVMTGVPTSKADEPAKRGAFRVVDCGQQLQSRKRGVGANKLGREDFTALSKGVSWWYNWHYETDDAPPNGAPMSFVPMVWGANPEGLAGLERHLAAGQRPRLILAINEPNLRGQSFMPPEKAATAYARIKTVADRYKTLVVGPQMSVGAAPGDSVTAFDPVENKVLTYTFMVPYLKAFFHYTNKAGMDVAAVGIHPYTNMWGLIGLTELTYKEFKRPVWITEFNNSDESQGMDAIRTYLIQTTDFMERSAYVDGYAFFKDRAAGHPKISLLADEPGKLTPLGEAYVHLPVHDADVYYRIPGRLQAENYVRLDKMEIWPTGDIDGFTHMASNEAGAWLDYNLQVDQGGKYALRFRVTGRPGNISVLKGEHLLGSVKSTPAQGQYATLEASFHLPAGAQTIRIRCDATVQGINWIEFTKL